MKQFLTVSYFVLAIFLLVAAISTHRYYKKIPAVTLEQLAYRPIPLWYKIAAAIGVIMGIFKFNEFVTLIGWFIFIGAMGLGWKSKIEQK